ncbi:MAG: DUF3784 domain-containing protein [Tyzzerella sp.]|nr:DUF3784 domain-containing protein [Tyzzerella sp.]
MKEIIISCILFLIAIGAFFFSYRSFKEKGFLFNNAYIYASKQERETMNKKPHYRQSAIVFFMIGVIFLLNGVSVLLSANWIFFLVIAIAIVAIVYAIISSVAIERRKTD